jgi:hypothetical protein
VGEAICVTERPRRRGSRYRRRRVSQAASAGSSSWRLLLTGVGTGLALPTLLATGSAALPSHSFATGSAVVNMLRQIGMAIGVAVLIAVLATPRTASDAVRAYRDGSIVIAAIAFAAGVVALALLARRRAPVADAPPMPAIAAEAAQFTG